MGIMASNKTMIMVVALHDKSFVLFVLGFSYFSLIFCYTRTVEYAKQRHASTAAITIAFDQLVITMPLLAHVLYKRKSMVTVHFCIMHIKSTGIEAT